MRHKRPIRILRIIARLNIGGPAIQAISLSCNLSTDHYQILLVCGKVGHNEGDMFYLAQEKGVEPYLIPELGREISILGDLKSLIALRKIIKHFKPDIIHTHTAKAGTLGRLAALSVNLLRGHRKRIRLIHTFHGHIFHSYFGSLKTIIFIQIERILARLTDRVIVISPRQKNDICQKYRIASPDTVRIIPLGFDLWPFSYHHTDDGREIRERYIEQFSDDTILVGIIGRLAHVKNHRMFLKAIKYLRDHGRHDRFKFFIIGDGELREELEHFSQELNLQNSVIFTGWQKDMPSFYGILDVVVLTSLNEGTPVTLIEAMASGKRVVATDVGGVRDILGQDEKSSYNGYRLARHGVLIPSGNSKILAEALLYIQENKGASKAMAERAREFVLNKHSLKRLIKEIESLYSELVYG